MPIINSYQSWTVSYRENPDKWLKYPNFHLLLEVPMGAYSDVIEMDSPRRVKVRWSPPEKPNRYRRLSLPGALAIALIMSGVALATGAFLFSQTGPTRNAPVAGMTTTCSTLYYNDTASAFIGADGIAAVFDCNGAPALSVNDAGTYTYSGLALPATAAPQVYLVPTGTVVTSSDCSGALGSIAMSGGGVVFGSTGDYNYCLDMNQGASFSGFVINWSG